MRFDKASSAALLYTAVLHLDAIIFKYLNKIHTSSANSSLTKDNIKDVLPTPSVKTRKQPISRQ